MRKILLILPLVVALCACRVFAPGGDGKSTTPQRTVYNSLATSGQVVMSTYSGYLGLVIAGMVPTNDVPRITEQYRNFKALFDAAVTTANYATNWTETPSDVAQAGGVVISNIRASQQKAGVK